MLFRSAAARETAECTAIVAEAADYFSCMSDLECVEFETGGSCVFDQETFTLCATEPPEWFCAVETQTDEVCDCGCGSNDDACSPEGEEQAACERCFVDDALVPCNTFIETPASWNCGDPAFRDTDCDCGCGAADPACDGAGTGELGGGVGVEGCDF